MLLRATNFFDTYTLLQKFALSKTSKLLHNVTLLVTTKLEFTVKLLQNIELSNVWNPPTNDALLLKIASLLNVLLPQNIEFPITFKLLHRVILLFTIIDL